MGRRWSLEKRGSEYLGGDDRWWVRDPLFPGKGNKIAKHRSVDVMERELGYEIPKGYHVHHIDENKENDDRSNLELLTASEHSKRVIHSQEGIASIIKYGKERRTVTQPMISMIKCLYTRGLTQTRIADIFGYHQTMISKCINGKFDL